MENQTCAVFQNMEQATDLQIVDLGKQMKAYVKGAPEFFRFGETIRRDAKEIGFTVIESWRELEASNRFVNVGANVIRGFENKVCDKELQQQVGSGTRCVENDIVGLARNHKSSRAMVNLLQGGLSVLFYDAGKKKDPWARAYWALGGADVYKVGSVAGDDAKLKLFYPNWAVLTRTRSDVWLRDLL